MDGGRRETAWARVKIRGRGGSGEPNDPAIRPHTRLRGATNFTRGGVVRGQPGLRGGRRGWNLRRGPSFRSASGSLGTLKGREPLSGSRHLNLVCSLQLAAAERRRERYRCLVSFGAWGSRRKVPGRSTPRIRFGTRHPKLQSTLSWHYRALVSRYPWHSSPSWMQADAIRGTKRTGRSSRCIA